MPSVERNGDLPKLEPKGKTLAELAKEFKVAKAKAKKFEKQMEQQKSLIHTIATGPLAKLMEDGELDFFNVPGVGALEYGIEVYPSIKKDDKPTFFVFLEKNGHADLITRDVHHKTLQAFVKEQLGDGNGLKFPEYVNIAKIPTVSLGKEKKSKKLKK